MTVDVILTMRSRRWAYSCGLAIATKALAQRFSAASCRVMVASTEPDTAKSAIAAAWHMDYPWLSGAESYVVAQAFGCWNDRIGAMTDGIGIAAPWPIADSFQRFDEIDSSGSLDRLFDHVLSAQPSGDSVLHPVAVGRADLGDSGARTPGAVDVETALAAMSRALRAAELLLERPLTDAQATKLRATCQRLRTFSEALRGDLVGHVAN